MRRGLRKIRQVMEKNKLAEKVVKGNVGPEEQDIILGGVRSGIDFRRKCRRKPWNIKSTEIR